jgi:hypothetical protein
LTHFLNKQKGKTMHSTISNHKRRDKRKASMLKSAGTPPVSTATHSSKEVAEHFLAWRTAQSEAQALGNNCSPDNGLADYIEYIDAKSR